MEEFLEQMRHPNYKESWIYLEQMNKSVVGLLPTKHFYHVRIREERGKRFLKLKYHVVKGSRVKDLINCTIRIINDFKRSVQRENLLELVESYRERGSSEAGIGQPASASDQITILELAGVDSINHGQYFNAYRLWLQSLDVRENIIHDLTLMNASPAVINKFIKKPHMVDFDQDLPGEFINKQNLYTAQFENELMHFQAFLISYRLYTIQHPQFFHQLKHLIYYLWEGNLLPKCYLYLKLSFQWCQMQLPHFFNIYVDMAHIFCRVISNTIRSTSITLLPFEYLHDCVNHWIMTCRGAIREYRRNGEQSDYTMEDIQRLVLLVLVVSALILDRFDKYELRTIDAWVQMERFVNSFISLELPPPASCTPLHIICGQTNESIYALCYGMSNADRIVRMDYMERIKVKLIRKMLRNGANPNALNGRNLVPFKLYRPSRISPRDTTVIQEMVNSGLHLDIGFRIPYDNPIDELLKTHIPSLKCQCTHRILEYKINYGQYLPASLRTFVMIHKQP